MFNTVKLICIISNVYKLIKVIFSLRPFFLLPKNFSTSCLVSSSMIFIFKRLYQIVNSSNVLGLDKIEDGEFSSTLYRCDMFNTTVFGGNDSVLT